MHPFPIKERKVWASFSLTLPFSTFSKEEKEGDDVT